MREEESYAATVEESCDHRGKPNLDDIGRTLRLRVVVMNAATGPGNRAEAVIPCDRTDPA